MTSTFRFAAAGALALAAFAAQAQPAATPPVTHAAPVPMPAPAAAAAPAPQANPADVASIDSIVKALYNVISGPVAAPRDWNRFHSLFMPGAKMMAVGMRKDGTIGTRVMTPADYVEHNAKTLLEVGFIESEKARTVDEFGQIAHVFTTYEARKGSATAEPFMRGINSIQLYNDGKRWWIVSLMWRAEDDKLKLPAQYLQSR